MPLDEKIAILAADIKHEFKLHTVDSIIYATAKDKNLILVTGVHSLRICPMLKCFK